MDIVFDVVAFIKTIFANKIVKKYSEDFANRALTWLRSTISGKDPQLVKDLEVDPNEINTHTRLAVSVHELLKDPGFLENVKAYMEQSRQYVVAENSISHNNLESGKDVVVEIENDKDKTSKSSIDFNTIKSTENTELHIKNTGSK